MRSSNCRKALFLSSALAGVMCLGGTAVAQQQQQQQQQQQGSIETVVVTAEKRAENLKDVPMSVAVVNAEDLKQRDVKNMDDLLGVVPGLTVEYAAGQQRIAIDGVANIFGSAPLVGIYLDDASVTVGSTNALNIATVDLDRVEVLRGPQGTLYGEGSMGGTIRFITHAPDLENYSFSADMGAEVTEGGAPSAYVKPVINIPLIDGQLGLRIAGSMDYRGGWISDPTNNLTDINYQNKKDVRAELLYKPNDDLTIKATIINHRSLGSTDTGFSENNTYTPMPPINGPTYVQDNYDFYNLTASWDFGFATLHSTTTDVLYSWRQVAQETVPVLGPETGPGAQPALEVVIGPPWNQTAHDLNEELRLTSDAGSPLQWDAGYFYKRTHGYSFLNEYEGYETSPGVFGPTSEAVADDWGYGNEISSSFFGNASYKFFNRLTIGVGLRYYEDTQTSFATFDDSALNNEYLTKTDHSLDPRIDATFAVTDNVNIYANVAKGFRSGGFNGPGVPGYSPEEVWRYELGTKGNFFNNTLSADLSVFYTSYDQYVVLALENIPPLGYQNVYSNGGDAKIEGVEWDFSWTPADQWLVRFNGEYIYSEFTKISVAGTAHDVGDPVDLVSPFQGTLLVQRNFEWKGKPGYFQVNYNRMAPESYWNRSTGPWYHGESSLLNIINARAELQWNDNLSLAIYGNNLTNDQGYLNPFIPELLADKERPRTFGIEAIVNF